MLRGILGVGVFFVIVGCCFHLKSWKYMKVALQPTRVVFVWLEMESVCSIPEGMV